VIREIAKFKIKAGHEDAFVAAAHSCLPLFQAARGFRSFSLERGVEENDTFYLLIKWETLEDHTIHFRESADFAEWRARVGQFFAEPPHVVHTQGTSA